VTVPNLGRAVVDEPYMVQLRGLALVRSMGRRPRRTVTLWQHSDLPPRLPDYEYAWDTGKTNLMMRGRPAGAEGLWPVSTSFGDPFFPPLSIRSASLHGWAPTSR